MRHTIPDNFVISIQSSHANIIFLWSFALPLLPINAHRETVSLGTERLRTPVEAAPVHGPDQPDAHQQIMEVHFQFSRPNHHKTWGRLSTVIFFAITINPRLVIPKTSSHSAGEAALAIVKQLAGPGSGGPPAPRAASARSPRPPVRAKGAEQCHALRRGRQQRGRSEMLKIRGRGSRIRGFREAKKWGIASIQPPGRQKKILKIWCDANEM